ncbi:MAG: acyl-protein synthetase [Verrucomicrobiaceae bacterium]|nr:MAG: acyl-protein synthetase [Verrucomicrobiaceae bacterium]
MIALSDIRNLPLHEKLRLMEALWDGISPEESALEVPEWHKDLLNGRERSVQEGKAVFVDWEEAKKAIRDAVS